jgi:hypothetical protein
MIRLLRRAHRRVILTLALVIPLILAVALLFRADEAVQPAATIFDDAR